jgi:rod shape-determining protein MreC
MKSFWTKYKKLILALLLLSLPFIFFYANAKEERDLNFFDKAVRRISAPLQEATRWVVDTTSDLWEDYVYLRDQRKVNAKLHSEVQKLRGIAQRAAELERENARLKRLLDLTDSWPKVRKVAARVIARSTSPYFRVYQLVLNTAHTADVRRGMPVVTPDGVVGRVSRVSGKYAEVQLVSDPDSSIDVIVQGSRVAGFLRGRGEANNYRCRLEYLSLPSLVREGDAIVTSGLGKGNLFPKGLLVGRVSHVLRKQFAVAQEVEVIPAADFGKVEEVFVLLNGAGAEAPPVPRPTEAVSDAERADGGAP